MSFLGEIKRRKVFQVAAVYAVVAWLLIQIVGAIIEPLSLPGSLDTVIIILLAVGFPIALIFAWVFDVTPQGIRSDADVTAGGAPTQQTGLRFSYISQALVLLAVGFLVFDQYVLQPGSIRPVPGPESAQVVQFSVPLAEEQSFTGDMASMIAVSADGMRIAYAANSQIYLRNLDEQEPRPVQGTAETPGRATSLAFSPDGQWLVYVHTTGIYSSHVVKRIPIGGGSPAPIYETEGITNFPHGLSWPTSDTILFANVDGIVRMPAEGGTPVPLISRGENERFYSPQLMSDNETVLFTVVPGTPGDLGGFDAAQVVMQSIVGSDRTVVVESGSAARYLPSGHLVYVQGPSLFAIPFDPIERIARGGAVAIFQDLRLSAPRFSDTANVAISDTGTLARIPAGRTGARETTLVWVDRAGQELEELSAQPDAYTSVRISPDGTKIALQVGDAVQDTTPAIWLFDLSTETRSELTRSDAGDDSPVWSSDSSRVFFRSPRDGAEGIYSIDVETRETEFVAPFAPGFDAVPWTISPDDRTLVLISNADVVALSLTDDDDEFARLIDDDVNESGPAIAPNGEWIAYNEFLGNELGIYLRPFPETSLTRIRVGTGLGAVFARDGSELLFVNNIDFSPDRVLISRTIDYAGSTPSLGQPQPLFSVGDYTWLLAGRRWDPDPSGERFLFIRSLPPPPAANQIDVVLNWFDVLKRRAPAD